MSLTHRQGLGICIALVASIGTFVFWRYLCFEYVYLFKDIGGDTLNQFYPRLVHIAEYLRTEGIPKWSFHQGMGQNLFPGDIHNPFRLILYILGPASA